MMTSIANQIKDEAFKENLTTGYDHQINAATLLLREGFVVQTEPLDIKGTYEDILDGKRFSDNFDLMVSYPVQIEVKSRNLHFTNVGNYPFSTIFVETKKSWKKRLNPPLFYLIVSQKTENIIVIPGNTHEHWSEITKRDSKQGFVETFMECPSEYVIDWDEFIQRMKVR